MTAELVPVAETAAAIAEQVVIKGDLARLTEQQRMDYYTAVCNSLGLNPLTRPFEYISLNGKLTLYATRSAADQLRAIRGITITTLDPRQIGDLYVVVATGRDRTGREDSSTGAVNTAGLRGENLANALMKAETKAKRRLTLSLAGLGWTDETEVDSIPGATRPEPPERLSLAARAAQKAAELAPTNGTGAGEEAAREEPEEAVVREEPDLFATTAPPLDEWLRQGATEMADGLPGPATAQQKQLLQALLAPLGTDAVVTGVQQVYGCELRALSQAQAAAILGAAESDGQETFRARWTEMVAASAVTA